MKEFEAFKFRTMKVDTDPAAHREYVRRSMSSAVAAEENGLYKLDQPMAVTDVGRVALHRWEYVRRGKPATFAWSNLDERLAVRGGGRGESSRREPRRQLHPVHAPPVQLFDPSHGQPRARGDPSRRTARHHGTDVRGRPAHALVALQ